ncbi:hypothetical protein CKO51_24850 [Rhodopirellula sp. SM50]|nr:hypothetical protein CKO51_24850 [Rhodopirellula sp. SM50]
MNSVASGVADLNEMTQAVGWAEDSSGIVQGIHFDYTTGVYTTLAGSAESINDFNQIAGSVGTMGSFWQNAQAIPDLLLPLPPTDSLSDVRAWALDLNNDGLVIGASEEVFRDSNGQVLGTITTAAVWRVTIDGDGVTSVQGPVALPPLPGHANSFAGSGCLSESISGVALVTGKSWGQREAVTWTISVNQFDELTIGAPLSLASPTSEGTGINSLGDVCGRRNERPFLAVSGQPLQTLSTPRNTQDGYALDVNDVGQVVGDLDVRKSRQAPRWYAYLWIGGERVDLTNQIASDSGWSRLERADTINNSGVIGGQGQHDVANRGFIMIPN